MNFNEELIELPFSAGDGRQILTHNPKLKWGLRDPKDICGMVLHQSLEEHASAEGNSKYHSGPNHIDPNGLPGLSYTGFIERSGKFYLANSVECATWSQGTKIIEGDENHKYIAFCVGGNFSGPGYKGTQEPTDAQMESVKLLWEKVKSLFLLKNSQLYGHYNFGKPACPGYTLMKFIDSVRAKGDGEQKRWPYSFETIDGRQKVLRDLGYLSISDDELGSWGPTSKGALVKFQRATNLTGDGVWGNKTESAILEALSRKSANGKG